jgi:coenzyme F420 hydrogenase subunit beta
MAALFSELYAKVISSQHICSGCGACVLLCPKNRLVLRDFRPEQISGGRNTCPINEDGRCGLCALVCPRLEEEHKTQAAPAEGFGAYREMIAARCTNPTLREQAQDGGLVSGLCDWGITSGAWSSFLGYARDESWNVVPSIVTKGGEVKKISGSKYTYASINEGLAQLHEAGHASTPFAMVGLPCHIDALRKLEEMRSKYVRGLQLAVGLLCTKAFTYQDLIIGRLANDMHITIADVEKMDIRKGVFSVRMRSGKEHRIPVKELQTCGHSGCPACSDFSAELADVSVGGLGVEGWTIAVIRTESGLEAMHAAKRSGFIETRSAEDFPQALSLLQKLTTWKRQNAVWK